MKPLARLLTSIAVLASGALVYSQGGAPRRFVTPPAQVIAIRAGRMFDSRTGTLLSNQVIVIRGDRISDVGAGVAVPAGAQVIDLSAATVLPGMIDAHVHLYPADNLPEATRTLVAGFWGVCVCAAGCFFGPSTKNRIAAVPTAAAPTPSSPSATPL